MKIFLTGGTGFVGRSLVSELVKRGHVITVLSRSGADMGIKGVITMKGDPTLEGGWQGALREQDVVINLAGSSIFSRWNEENKRLIRLSRVQTTKNLVEGLKTARDRVLLVSTSAVGFYGFRGEEVLTEDSPPGNDFLASVAREWEEAAKAAIEFGHRVVLARFGIVLGKSGGALAMMIRPFKYFMGSGLGSGKQYFSWIHEKDLVNIFLFLIERQDLQGPINLTSPYPVTNQEMTRLISKVMKRPIFLPNVPAFLLRLIVGEFSEVLVNGQRVYPKRLLDMGYRFLYPLMETALYDLLMG